MRTILALALVVFHSGADFLRHATVAHAAQPEWCEVLLSPEIAAREDTDGFIGYLGQLLESQTIGTPELSALHEGLENGIIINPISEASAQVDSSLAIHREGLQERLARSQIDPVRVLTWVQGQLSERNRVRVDREETRKTTRDPHQQMLFLPVEPGTVKMARDQYRVVAESFYLMSTPVTQRHWSLIMGFNPSKFVEGESTVEITINDSVVKMQPNHPVEEITWMRAENFVQKINDLSASGDPLLFQLIPDHQQGDEYRLPSDEEWEFVVRDRGRSNDEFHFGNLEENLVKHGWFEKNSGGSTQAVGQLHPLVVDGQAFYDLHGNVWEWTSYGVIRGGSWMNSAKRCQSSERGTGSRKIWNNSGVAGVRLARSSRRRP